MALIGALVVSSSVAANGPLDGRGKKEATTGLPAPAAIVALTAETPGTGQTPGTGMCSGRTDPNLVVIAHANGRPGLVPKFILNVSTDADEVVTGSLVLGRGADRLVATDWCRAWQHIPGTQGKCGEEYPEGATTAHAVGYGTLRDGTRVLVRSDVRQTEKGGVFRVRYRVPPADEGSQTEGDSCEDDSWTWLPPRTEGEEEDEGWYPLRQVQVGYAS
ncbi:MAG TPA: hypothetical protein VE088_02805 [Gaiellaceae bacterium]|nr:hypothetical protein [Gaiellaceae bacterium]